MNMKFKRKLPIPQEIKEMYPISSEGEEKRKQNLEEMKAIIDGRDAKRLLLIIGPCSADNEEAVMTYIYKLGELQKKVNDVFVIVPRIYTNKPRTTGAGYKGMLHQPDPLQEPDILKGLIAIRKIHMRAVNETGFSCADEMLYPENHRFLSDVLGYVAVGARSVENQFHRLTASGLDLPVGMKNPTSGGLRIMMNSIKAAQSGHTFIYRNWEVETAGNPYVHAILRGYVDNKGQNHPNYHIEDLEQVVELYKEYKLANPAVIVDCNHDNSGKKYLEQIRISKEVLYSMEADEDVKKIVKGLMIESYLEDGNQHADEGTFGKSITDPCLGWKKSEQLVLDLAKIRRKQLAK
ncbi:MAG: 3-deoxy-7-phosphoheptulonate synthase [Bacilli bacterium]|nr:3-deoxy-7-phosphoheptulonate synthase [Bacilli bacterium]